MQALRAAVLRLAAVSWIVLLSVSAYAQAATDFTGVWAPYRGGRGADPALAAPSATPLVLKPEYAAAFEARRKAEADAAARGEPIASGAVACVPSGARPHQSPTRAIASRRHATSDASTRSF